MLLTPKRRKFRKTFVKNPKWKSTRWSTVAFGEFGLKATTSAFISNRQIEAARKVIIRRIRKVGKVWIRIFPDVPITKMWLEMPMGKGKGDVDIYKASVKKGRIIMEITGLDAETSKDVLTRAAKKLSVKTRVVVKWEIR